MEEQLKDLDNTIALEDRRVNEFEGTGVEKGSS